MSSQGLVRYFDPPTTGGSARSESFNAHRNPDIRLMRVLEEAVPPSLLIAGTSARRPSR
jgi:hypothetical protein